MPSVKTIELKHLALVCGLLATLTLLFVLTQTSDQHVYEDQLRVVGYLKQWDATLIEDVLKSRFGLLQHYDSLVHALGQLHGLEARLEYGSGLLSSSSRLELAPRVRRYQDLLGEQEALVEQFKSQNAILQNSLRYLPNAIEDFDRSSKESSDYKSFRSLTQQLLGEAFRFIVIPNENQQFQIFNLLYQLHRLSERDAGPVAVELEHVDAHVRLILKYRVQVQGLMKRFTALPTAPALDDLLHVYQQLNYQAMHRTDRYRWLMYLFSVLLVSFIVYILIRLHWTAQMLVNANQTLEFRVQDRTAELTTANAALQQEILERRRTQTALQDAKEEAESASRAKTEFLASMSHEIRTPMNAILGMADLLNETSTTDEQRQYVHTLKQGGDALLTLINDVLDLSKIEAGRLELERIDFDLEEVVTAVGELMAIRAHLKGLELICEIEPDVATHLVGDPARLRQILVNLLSNAIKFTERGEIVLKVERGPGPTIPGRRHDEPPTHDHESFPYDPKAETVLHLSVRDTGIGIPADKLEMIFDRFTQVDASTTRQYGGTGLGLSISRRLAQLMKGHMWVDSVAGLGSTFHVVARFGIQPAGRSPMAAVPTLNLKDARVLVIDDNATNRFILRRMLTGLCAEVQERSGGEDGLRELTQAREQHRPYHIVLLDSRMPTMDGFQVARTLQASPDLADTIIVMLTSDDRNGDIARCRSCGIAKYLVKPIKRVELLRSLTGCSSVQGLPEPVPTQEATPSGPNTLRPLRILLVDDSPMNQLLVRAYVKGMPYELEVAENGAIAVEKVRAEPYDVVFMDIQMPVLDGYQATAAIRRWEHEQGRPKIPIIALTAAAFNEDEQRCFEAGCTAYLSKPVKKQTFLEAIVAYTQAVPAS
jgi:signal transduction histidine kinase/response regulator RpfG family c-di-GMP phosphodiesterase